MSESKHSPTPWALKPVNDGGVLLVRGGGDIREHPQSHVQIVPAEDARFIVRAVNAHDSLLAVARELTSPDGDVGRAIALAHAAMAKLEGR